LTVDSCHDYRLPIPEYQLPITNLKIEMNSVWQQLTLTNLPLLQWQSGSYLLNVAIGNARSWRQSSWLMQWAEPLGFVLLALTFGLGPFVNNALVGVLMAACAAFLGAADCFRRSRDRPDTNSPAGNALLGHCDGSNCDVSGKGGRFYWLDEVDALFAVFLG
jgi:hypothetical protein